MTTDKLSPMEEFFLSKAIAFFKDLAQNPNAVVCQMRDTEASSCFAGAAQIEDTRDAELSMLRARVAELEEERHFWKTAHANDAGAMAKKYYAEKARADSAHAQLAAIAAKEATS